MTEVEIMTDNYVPHIVVSKESMEKIAKSLAGLFDSTTHMPYDPITLGATWSTNQEDEGVHVEYEDIDNAGKIITVMLTERARLMRYDYNA